MFIIFLSLILTLVASYCFSIILYGQLPLPHLYHPNDFFMDLWNVAWMSQTGTLYSTGGFYHPIYAFVFRILDPTPSLLPLAMRHEFFFVNYLIVAAVLAVSVLNFVKNKDRFGLFGSFIICFLSAPLVFILSRMNLLFVCFIFVSAYFYTDYSVGRRGFFKFGVIPCLILSKAYFLVLLFLRVRKVNDFGLIVCVLTTVTLWALFGYLAISDDYSADRLSLTLWSLPSNVLNFGGHSQPIYEAVGLNYSVFGFVAIAKKLGQVFDLPYLTSLLSTIENAKYIFMVIGILIIRKMSEKLNDATIFLLTLLGLALIFPQIGGYAMVLIIPVLKELDRFLSSRQAALFIAVVFCPIDAGFILGNGPPVLVTQFGPDLFHNISNHLDEQGFGRRLSPIRNDISLLAILRPLAILFFWVAVLSQHFRPTLRAI